MKPIEFVYATEPQAPRVTFAWVESDQFFVHEGRLCQKRHESSYTILTKADGKPFCNIEYDVSPDMVIDRILPVIQRINY